MRLEKIGEQPLPFVLHRLLNRHRLDHVDPADAFDQVRLVRRAFLGQAAMHPLHNGADEQRKTVKQRISVSLVRTSGDLSRG